MYIVIHRYRRHEHTRFSSRGISAYLTRHGNVCQGQAGKIDSESLYRLFVVFFFAVCWGTLSTDLSPSVGLEHLRRRAGLDVDTSVPPSANVARLLLIGRHPSPDLALSSFSGASSEKLGLPASCFDEVDIATGWTGVSRRWLPGGDSELSLLSVARLEKPRHIGSCFGEVDRIVGWICTLDERTSRKGLAFGSVGWPSGWSSRPVADFVSGSVSGLSPARV